VMREIGERSRTLIFSRATHVTHDRSDSPSFFLLLFFCFVSLLASCGERKFCPASWKANGQARRIRVASRRVASPHVTCRSTLYCRGNRLLRHCAPWQHHRTKADLTRDWRKRRGGGGTGMGRGGEGRRGKPRGTLS